MVGISFHTSVHNICLETSRCLGNSRSRSSSSPVPPPVGLTQLMEGQA